MDTHQHTMTDAQQWLHDQRAEAAYRVFFDKLAAEDALPLHHDQALLDTRFGEYGLTARDVFSVIEGRARATVKHQVAEAIREHPKWQVTYDSAAQFIHFSKEAFMVVFEHLDMREPGDGKFLYAPLSTNEAYLAQRANLEKTAHRTLGLEQTNAQELVNSLSIYTVDAMREAAHKEVETHKQYTPGMRTVRGRFMGTPKTSGEELDEVHHAVDGTSWVSKVGDPQMLMRLQQACTAAFGQIPVPSHVLTIRRAGKDETVDVKTQLLIVGEIMEKRQPGLSLLSENEEARVRAIPTVIKRKVQEKLAEPGHRGAYNGLVLMKIRQYAQQQITQTGMAVYADILVQYRDLLSIPAFQSIVEKRTKETFEGLLQTVDAMGEKQDFLPTLRHQIELGMKAAFSSVPHVLEGYYRAIPKEGSAISRP